MEAEKAIMVTVSVVSKTITEELAPVRGRRIKFSVVTKISPTTSIIDRACCWPAAVSFVPIHWRSAKSTGQGDNSCR